MSLLVLSETTMTLRISFFKFQFQWGWCPQIINHRRRKRSFAKMQRIINYRKHSLQESGRWLHFLYVKNVSKQVITLYYKEKAAHRRNPPSFRNHYLPQQCDLKDDFQKCQDNHSVFKPHWARSQRKSLKPQIAQMMPKPPGFPFTSTKVSLVSNGRRRNITTVQKCETLILVLKNVFFIAFLSDIPLAWYDLYLLYTYINLKCIFFTFQF